MLNIRMEPQFDSDVVVAGAGPAGASAAFYMARAGLNVILIDWQTFPRDKVCGDFVGPVALLELQKLGMTDFSEYEQANIIRRAALFLDGQELIARPIPSVEGLPPYGRVIPRMVLDGWILDVAREAGVHVLEGSRVTQFETAPDGITVVIKGSAGVQKLRTKLLVGADGSNSTVARLFRNHPSPYNDRIIAVRAYFEDIDGPSDQADLYFAGESFPGYHWLFPTGRRTANVGVGMVLETVPHTSDHLRELLVQLIKKDVALRGRLHKAKMMGKIVGWPLTTYNPQLPIVGDRVLLAGDAAGLINPLNGEGIQYALLSGRWASDIALSCVQQNDFSKNFLSAYANRVEKELRYDMALSTLIVQLIRNRTLNIVWLLALRIIVARALTDRSYAHIVGGILAGLVPASDAVSFKVVGSTLEQVILSTSLDTLINVLEEPQRLAVLGLETARIGFDITYDTVQYPADFLEWGYGLVSGAAELASQVAKHTIEPSRKNSTMVHILVG